MDLLHKYLSAFIIILFLSSCQTEQVILPPLTYTGEEPRIQDPLSPEESQKHIQLPRGFTAELFAAEPDIINPIQFTWDERGRLWVVQSMDYPHGLDNDVGGDRITICEDTDGDGKADSFTDFATDQSLTTGIVLVKGGAVVAQAPDMVFLADDDGDDKMDSRTVLFSGFGTYDTHAGPASLRYGPDNNIWGSVGYSGFENNFDGKLVNFTRGVFRFDRDGTFLEPIGQFNNNTWGMGITQDFKIFGSTANNNHCCYVGIPLRYYDYLDNMPSWAINSDFIQGHYEITTPDTIPLQQVDVRGGYTAAAGANFYTATNYPKVYQDQMYVNEPTGHLIHLAKIVSDGAGFSEEDGGNIFASTDAWTAPVFSETGPDGNLWVADWYNPVIQHNPDKRGMDNQIWNDEKGEGNAHINPNRDKGHGRIYIIKYKGKQDNSIAALDPNDNAGLLVGLQSDNMFWRQTAQRLIVENQKTELTPELIKLARKNASGLNGTSIHALWSLKGLGALEETSAITADLLREALANKSDAVKRNALALLPSSTEGSTMLLNSGLLNSANLQLRLDAMLRAAELPEVNALFHEMEKLARLDVNQSDKWLAAAVNIYFRKPNTELVDENALVMVVPSAKEESTQWKYTTIQPKGNWQAADFDDSNWSSGPAGFGTTDHFPFIRSTWETENIWLRKKVTLQEPIIEPVLKILHDEDFQVYLNGQLALAETGSNRKHKFIKLDAQHQMPAGDNAIAVHCHNERNRQYIDLGIGKEVSIESDLTLRLETVPQKMAYDQPVLHAMAGEDLEIILKNTDEMPHNLVLIEEGSLEAFGKIVDEFLKKPEAAEMEYIPPSRYVLGATGMLDPEEEETIRLRVPDKAGDYPFVCTFPGHWRVMQGVLKVSPRGTYISPDSNALVMAVMGGGGSHEFLKYFGVADGKIMNQNRTLTVCYTERSEELNSWLQTADLLTISNNKPFDASTKQTIFDRVNGGMPMMIYHPSTWYNWEDWPEYNLQLVAGGTRSHEKLQEFEVEVIKPNHPIMKGVPKSFRIIDELYRWEQDPKGPAIEVLAISRGLASGDEFPCVWVVKHPKARIVANTLGHDADAHGLPAYQTILNNSLNYIKKGVKKNRPNI